MTLEEFLAKLDTGAAEKAAEALHARAPFDVLVVGGGPAGSAAAIYAARKGMRHRRGGRAPRRPGARHAGNRELHLGEAHRGAAAVLLELGEERALDAAGILSRGTVVELNRQDAIEAARLSVQLKLAMANSIILAAARAYGATLWTQDAHFKGIEGVQYIEKKP